MSPGLVKAAIPKGFWKKIIARTPEITTIEQSITIFIVSKRLPVTLLSALTVISAESIQALLFTYRLTPTAVTRLARSIRRNLYRKERALSEESIHRQASTI